MRFLRAGVKSPYLAFLSLILFLTTHDLASQIESHISRPINYVINVRNWTKIWPNLNANSTIRNYWLSHSTLHRIGENLLDTLKDCFKVSHQD
jgi:hypothetical protein